jgi:hypothetical protein
MAHLTNMFCMAFWSLEVKVAKGKWLATVAG